MAPTQAEFDEAARVVAETQVTFFSRGKNLRLVRQGEVREPVPGGGQRLVQKGLVYEFAPVGQLTVMPGQDTIYDGPLIQYDDDGTTVLGPAAQDALTWLRAHREYGLAFEEVTTDAAKILPTLETVMVDIANSMATQDRDRLAQILAREGSTHGRAAVIEAAYASLQAISGGRAVPDKPKAKGPQLPGQGVVDLARQPEYEHPETTAEDTIRGLGDIPKHEPVVDDAGRPITADPLAGQVVGT